MTLREQRSASENAGLGMLVKLVADPVVWWEWSGGGGVIGAQTCAPGPGESAPAAGSERIFLQGRPCAGPRTAGLLRGTAAGGAGLRRRRRRRRGHRSAGPHGRTGAARVPHARTPTRRSNFAARLATQRAFSCSCQRPTTPGKSSQPGKTLNHPAQKPVHSKVRTKGKKKYRSSEAGQGEAAAAKGDFLLASPGAPGRVPAGAGRAARCPAVRPRGARPSVRPVPAPAGSMNERAWK